MTEARITQAGVYVETSANQIDVTQAGVYVETSANQIDVTQAGVYVEILLPPTEAGPGVWVIYDGIDITEYVHSVKLEASINQWDATDFASTGTEFGSGLAKWKLPLTGQWEPDWDDTIMPDAVTPLTTPKTVTVYFWHRPTAKRVEYTWHNGGVIKEAGINGAIDSAIGWGLELVLAGAPNRTAD